MMKRFILASLAVVLLLAGIGYLVYYRGIYVDFKPEVSVTAHFRTQGKEIQYLDGDTWKPMEIRGVDLSSNIPGEAMLDFVPAYEDYSRWLEQIGEMGANTIRVHTVMDDDFYEAFYDYNTTKEKPLYLLQGLSVPDRANYGAGDIYQEEFVDLLLENATKAVDVIHGNRAIELGNFTGTGWYQWDVSPWTLGYLLGHEWDSGIIAYTNHSTLGETSYQGTYFYTKPEASRFETAMAKLMDRVTAYESDKYKEQRLISFVNSPWDDPFVYDTLYNARFDTYNQVDMEHIGDGGTAVRVFRVLSSGNPLPGLSEIFHPGTEGEAGRTAGRTGNGGFIQRLSDFAQSVSHSAGGSSGLWFFHCQNACGGKSFPFERTAAGRSPCGAVAENAKCRLDRRLCVHMAGCVGQKHLEYGLCQLQLWRG